MGVVVILAEERMNKDPVRGTETKKHYVNSRVRCALSFPPPGRPLTTLSSRYP